MDATTHYLVFGDDSLLVEGVYATILPALRRHASTADGRPPLVFDAESGRQVDFDLRAQAPFASVPDDAPSRGRGRPKLGVTSREVTLLPRHWEWLSAQPSGISAAIRRLVENAMKDGPGREKARRIREAAGNVLTAIAGDKVNFEEAMRALYASDVSRFESLVGPWPAGIRAYAIRELHAAVEAEAPAAPATAAATRAF